MGIRAELRAWWGNKPTKGATLRLSGGRPGGTTTFARCRDEAGGAEETRGLVDDGRTRGEVVNKDGAEVVEGEEGIWEGRL